MLTVKNGLKSILRTPWKSVLFSAVLILLSALLTVSLCVFFAVQGYLSDCDDYYHTIANLEYVGADYPKSSVYDGELAKAVAQHREELDALLRSDSVISYEAESNTVALAEGLHRSDADVLEPSSAVLRLKNVMYDERLDIYLMQVEESLYSCECYDGTVLFVRTARMPCDGGEKLENGRDYYAVGRFYKGQTANPWFFAEETSFREAGQTVTLPPFTAADAGEEAAAAYRQCANVKRQVNDSLRVYYTAALADYPPFHQQTIPVTTGRLFTREEYDARARVCVVSERTAGFLGLDVGDRIHLTVYASEGELYEPGTWESYDEGGFEIVGVYRDSDDYPYRVFLPDANAAKVGIRPVTGYRLGHFRLQNDKVAALEQLAQPLRAYGFRVSVYDQGYAAATEPMRELMLISVIFLGVCLLLAITVHAMQSHLFVSRQKESALTMRAMGTDKPRVVLYFLSASLLLSAVSVVLGGALGKLLEGRVMEVLKNFAAQSVERDYRFSGSRLSLTRTLAFEPSISFSVYARSAALLIAGSLLFTVAFALGSLRGERFTAGKRRFTLRLLPKRARRSSHLTGVLKYALISIRRGTVRTAAVLLLCCVTAVFFGRLTSSLDGHRAQLEAYRSNAVITGFATDYKGQLIDGLKVRSWPVKLFLETGCVSDYSVTDTVAFCELIGISVSADGTEYALPDPRIPAIGSFAMETLIDRLISGSRWLAASSVNGSPIFHGEKSRNIQWLDGYSDADFAGGARICVLPKQMMEANGITLGDTVRFLFYAPYYFTVDNFGTVDVLVVGAYNADVSKSYVFSPISYFPAVDILERQDESFAGFDVDNITIRTYDSFLFTLRSAAELDEVRQALADSGFTWVHSGDRAHPFVILEDEIYLDTTHSMERQIQYVGMLYNALYGLTGVIGFALAWLLSLSRRKELALMRAMGTQRSRILRNFTFEQLLLSSVGLALGIGLSLPVGNGVSGLCLGLCGGFWLIWNCATLLCLLMGLSKPSFASLTEPE